MDAENKVSIKKGEVDTHVLKVSFKLWGVVVLPPVLIL